MKILFAQADVLNNETAMAALVSEGHELIAAKDGNEAIHAMQENPDLVIMEANLPIISGYECCRLIKHDKNIRHTPVVMLMPMQDPTSWARFSECGADDFIGLPLYPQVVKVKVRLLQNLKDLYQRLDVSHRHAEQEIRLAKHMFDSITRRQPQEIDFLHSWGLSAGHFCGDLFIFERTPENHLHVFLGDFTGHGLAAAMGALPVADIFFAMTRNGSGIAEIISEANRKLYEIMPTGKFCAATFLRLDADYSKIEIWNGGMPPVLFAGRQNMIVGKCESFHLPLGIVESAEFNPQPKQFSLTGIRSVVLYSDGLTDARNPLGECFGEERLAQVIARRGKGQSVYDRIKLNVLSFLEGLEPHDDVSLAIITIS